MGHEPERLDVERTKPVSVHRLRRRARQREREIQRVLDHYGPRPDMPAWARGVKTERIGLFQFAVILTSHKGH